MKSAGSVTGSTVLDLPTSNWHELYIEGYFHGSIFLMVPITLKINSKSTHHYHGSGYMTRSDLDAAGLSALQAGNYGLSIYVNQNNVLIVDGSDGNVNWAIQVYYR